MLRPQMARTFLNLLLTLSLVLVALSAIELIWGAFQGVPNHLNITVPTSTGLRLHGQTFRITQVLQTIQQPPRWVQPLVLISSLGLLAFLFLTYRRIQAFVNRLFLDPFDQANLRDLRQAVIVAVLWQVATLLGTVLTRSVADKATPYETLLHTLGGVPGIEVEQSVVHLDLSTLNVLSLLGVNVTPLVVAAALVILSAVLQQAALVRHEERRLRHEQDLTI